MRGAIWKCALFLWVPLPRDTVRNSCPWIESPKYVIERLTRWVSIWGTRWQRGGCKKQKVGVQGQRKKVSEWAPEKGSQPEWPTHPHPSRTLTQVIPHMLSTRFQCPPRCKLTPLYLTVIKFV